MTAYAPQTTDGRPLVYGPAEEEQAFRRAFMANRQRQQQNPPTQASRYARATHYETAHAPPGGVTIAGKQFKGGQFIPGEVMASASPEERHAVETGQSRNKPLPPPGGVTAQTPPPADQLTVSPRLSPDEQELERQSQLFVRQNYEHLKQQYLAANATTDANGNVVSITLNTDEWRSLIPGYTGTNAGAVHAASSWCNKRLAQEAIRNQRGKGNNRLMVLAGGGGSGKGTATQEYFTAAQYPVVLDQVSDAVEKLEGVLDDAKRNGYEPVYVFVDRPPQDAAQGVIGRALNLLNRGQIPRTVNLDIALRANIESRKTALELFKRRPDITPNVIDNRGGRFSRRLITDRAEAIVYLETRLAEDEAAVNAGLAQRLKQHVIDRHEEGEIPPALVDGFLGRGWRGVQQPVQAARYSNQPRTIHDYMPGGDCNFNFGDCSDIVYLMTEQAVKDGVGGFHVVHGPVTVDGKLSQGGTHHTWLEHAGQVVDPTVSQFHPATNIQYHPKIKQTPEDYLKGYQGMDMGGVDWHRVNTRLGSDQNPPTQASQYDDPQDEFGNPLPKPADDATPKTSIRPVTEDPDAVNPPPTKPVSPPTKIDFPNAQDDQGRPIPTPRNSPAAPDSSQVFEQGIRDHINGLDPSALQGLFNYFHVDPQTDGAMDVLHRRAVDHLRAQTAQENQPQPQPFTIPQTGARHAAFEHPHRQLLESGEMVNMQRIGEADVGAKSGANETWFVQFPDESAGVFKPHYGEYPGLRPGIDAGTYYNREVASSVVADVLGFDDLVPKTSFREHYGKQGSMQQFVPGSQVAKRVDDFARHDGPADLARAAVFDYVTGNVDRHNGNWLIGPDGKLVLIDNGLSLPYEYHPKTYNHLTEVRHGFTDSPSGNTQVSNHTSNMEMLREATLRNLPMPDVSAMVGKWPEVEQALRDSGIDERAIHRTKQRFDQVVSGRFQNVRDLPAYWMEGNHFQPALRTVF